MLVRRLIKRTDETSANEEFNFFASGVVRFYRSPFFFRQLPTSRSLSFIVGNMLT